MSECRELALLAALKSVMATAVEQGFDINRLTEAAADKLIADRDCEPQQLSGAISEIERAADALA